MCRCISFLTVALASSLCFGQAITIATYNIEHFHDFFLVRRISATRPSVLPKTPEVQALLERDRRHADEESWEVAQVILDPNFSPDVLVIQEGCEQADLEYFNHRWLKDAYATVIVFPSNTDQNQHLGMMLKPGFNVIQRKDQYYKETDPIPNERGNLRFARGPAFVLVEAPGGYRFWVGTNHQKSKSGNSLPVTQWRNREAKRTHEIIKDLEMAGPSDVVFLGDMNDELGIQMFESQAGGDVISNLVGPPSDGIILATRTLAEAGKISYFGYERGDYRSLIDHIFVTNDMKDQIIKVNVFQNNFTAPASDHAPVMMRIRPDVAARSGRNN